MKGSIVSFLGLGDLSNHHVNQLIAVVSIVTLSVAVASWDRFRGKTKNRYRRSNSQHNFGMHSNRRPRIQENGHAVVSCESSGPSSNTSNTSNTPGESNHEPLRLGFGWTTAMYSLSSELSEFFVFLLTTIAIITTFYGNIMFGIMIISFIFLLRLSIPLRSQREQQKKDRIQLLREIDPVTLRSLLMDDLPRWVNFPDVEKCEWFNSTLKTLWPYLKTATTNSIRSALQPALDENKPESIYSLGFKSLDLGRNPPLASGIKSYPNIKDEEIVLDITLNIELEDSDIVFTVGSQTSKLMVSIEMSDFKLSGTLRLVLKPLFPRWPLVGALSLSFIDKPEIEFSMTAMHVDVMEIPILSRALSSLIKQQITTHLVWPQKLVIPLVSDLNSMELEYLKSNRPLGILRVADISIQDVQPPSFISSFSGKYSYTVHFYVRLDKQCARNVYNSTGANYFKVLYIFVMDPRTDVLSLMLESKSFFGKRKPLSEQSISLDHLKPFLPKHEFISLGSKTGGSIGFSVTWLPFVQPKDDIRSTKTGLLATDFETLGALFVKLYRAENIKAVDYNGLSDPYVQLTIGGSVKTSSIKKQTLDPTWEPPELFEFIVENPRQTWLSIQVMNKDYMTKDTEIGVAKINVNQVRNSGRLSGSWSFESGKGSIHLELDWRGFTY